MSSFAHFQNALLRRPPDVGVGSHFSLQRAGYLSKLIGAMVMDVMDALEQKANTLLQGRVNDKQEAFRLSRWGQLDPDRPIRLKHTNNADP